MFAGKHVSRAKRRGIVLIVILGMLGLLALIGVTFATISGQARVNARNYVQAQQQPNASDLFDFALAQLIDDTGLPTSAIRGHSLKRDMYGNDALNNGFLVYSPYDGSQMAITLSTTVADPYGNGVTCARLVTNVVATNNSLYGYDFTRWYVRLVPSGGVLPDGTPINQQLTTPSQTFEVLQARPGTDTTNPGVLVLVVALPDQATAILNPVSGNVISALAQPPDQNGNSVLGTGSPVPFILDGRYLRAFNGPGMDALGKGMSMYGNFRVNGDLIYRAANGGSISSSTTVQPGDPDGQIVYGTSGATMTFPGMDEDYDACDLENWFLALQSADGQVIIPSFHRPGILQVDHQNTPNWDDWQVPLYNTSTGVYNPLSAAKFLRPRSIDGHSPLSFPDLKADPVTSNTTFGKINYDVDNDGDGQTDSVWLDLGYAPRRDATGKLYKPLFAFMVIGLNGRLPLNTVGNLSQRANSGTPLFTHATHLGNSPSEIDPTWALQNANVQGIYNQDQADNAGATSGGTYNSSTLTYTPGDSGYSGISVALTQLRNLLTGTRLYDKGVKNGDTNFVMTQTVAGRMPYPLPNNIADMGDTVLGSSQVVANSSGISVNRLTQPVPGRWGDAGLIPTTQVPVTSMNPSPLFSPGQSPATLIFQTPVAPGQSSYGYVGGNTLQYIGGTGDDNLNVYDPTGESSVTYDPAGALFMPVERVRRFVTPIDTMGDGQVLTWDDNSFALNVAAGGGVTGIGTANVTTFNQQFFPFINDTGGDHFGRVGFFRYFRPPGIAQATASYPSSTIVPFSSVVLPDLTNNQYHGFEGFRNPKLRITTDPNSPGGSYYYPINPLIGGMPYDISGPSNTQGINNPSPTPPQGPQLQPVQPPTFDANIFSFFASGGVYPGIGGNPVYWPFAIGNMNEPDEVSLYDPNGRDQIFGPADLEWLYRYQDADGASLQSRLSQLAPVSFLNTIDGTRRRRLFSLESWEPTNFIWANDNPVSPNYLGVPSTAQNYPFSLNSRFTSTALATTLAPNQVYFTNQLKTDNASFFNLPGQNTDSNLGGFSPFATIDPVTITITPTPNYQYPASPNLAFWDMPTPSVAHRDRKINLNFPLPVSNSQYEPVRQKWIRETYKLLKAILPPKAIDTPQELAQLSQFVVNIIDFRDPDCTMTKFVNTDITVVPGTNTPTNTPPTIQFTTTPFTGTNPFTSGQPTYLDYNPYWETSAATASNYLVQYGMEYPPVAITEVLAFAFNGSSPAGLDQKRLFVEIVNTLTESGINLTSGPGAPNACDLDLKGWDFVIMPDDGVGRPDPYSGQIPSQVNTTRTITSYPVAGTPSTPNTTTSSSSVPGTGTTQLSGFPALGTASVSALVPALNAGTDSSGNNSDRATNYYYVFGGGAGSGLKATPATTGTTGKPTPQTTTYDFQAPQMEAYLDMTNELMTPNTYYWVYLRRPPNPFDDHYTPNNPNENRVVVDSFRFFYNGSKWLVNQSTTPPTAKKNTEYLYSLQRSQPFRGGQMIAQFQGVPAPTLPNTPAPANSWQVAAYGYSEQSGNGLPQNGYKGFNSTPATNDYYGTNTLLPNTKGSSPPSNEITYPIGQSLGINPRATDTDNKWDYLVFNDRDFTSVAELLMVPGCPPGLFTKQFVEVAPWDPASAPTTYYNGWITTYGTTPPDASVADPNTLYPNNAPPSFDVKDPTPTKDPTTGLLTITAPAKVGVPHTYPYLVDNFFYTGAPEYTYPPAGSITPASTAPYIGGPSGGGWFKMFEFFEVPSPAFGATGLVAQGNNFDWFRQDVKPGLLNLNLIIDEEVFLGLMGFDSSDNYQQAVLTSTGTNPTSTRFQLNMSPLVNATNLQLPQVVTQLNNVGSPSLAYAIPNNGAFVVTSPNGNGSSALKASFSDFLKIRGGGTNYLFGLLAGVPLDRPFHSLSYSDIDSTVMRPAYPPPPLVVGTTPFPVPTGGAWPASANTTPGNVWPNPGYTQDPGIKNPYLAVVSQQVQSPPVQPPPIPPRRLFQVPDAYGSPVPGSVDVASYVNTNVPSGATYTAPTILNPPSTQPAQQGSNASVYGDPNVNTQVNNQVFNLAFTLPASLFNITYDLTVQSCITPSIQTSPILQATQTLGADKIEGVGPVWLGNHNGMMYSNTNYAGIYDNNNSVNGRLLPPVPFQQADMRQHPYFRNEWMQRVMNLTTVRTHQFAVWITVGFFEVTQPGNPQLALTSPKDAYDQLGLELGVLEGSTTRFRGFFLLDRTRATGFNPTAPGDFRDVIVYRKTIE